MKILRYLLLFLAFASVAHATPAADIPAKFPIPWGADAGGAYIRTIPEASQIGIQNGAASLTDGFPPLTFVPTGAGGVPPFGQDFNGIFNQITQWNQWQAMGGPVTYDSVFSSAIGGYPKGALLSSTSVGNFWVSTVDNNTSNPDSGGSNWIGFTASALFGTDTGTANAMTVTLPGTIPSLAYITGRQLVIRKSSFSNTGSATLKVGSFTAAGVVHPDGTALSSGELPGSGMFEVIYDGSLFQLQSVGYQAAPIVSPALTGVPTAPTASTGTNTTQLATTAFVTTAIANIPSVTYATTSSPGIVQLATSAQAIAGTNTTNAIVPTGLNAAIAAVASSGSTAHPLASVLGTGSIVNGDFAIFDGTGGSIEDGGTPGTAAFVSTTGPSSDPVPSLAGSLPVVLSDVLTFSSTSGNVHDSGVGISSLALLASPAFTGNPTAPTQLSSNNSTRLATTAYVTTAIANIYTGALTTGDVATFANTNGVLQDGGTLGTAAFKDASSSGSHPLASSIGSFTSNDVICASGTGGSIADCGVAISSLAPLASPAFTGVPTAPTPAASDDSRTIATTAFVNNYVFQGPVSWGRWTSIAQSGGPQQANVGHTNLSLTYVSKGHYTLTGPTSLNGMFPSTIGVTSEAGTVGVVGYPSSALTTSGGSATCTVIFYDSTGTLHDPENGATITIQG